MTKEQLQDHIKRCCDNTATIKNYEDLGVLHFARTFLPPCQPHRQAPIHYHICRNAYLDMLNPLYRVRQDRQASVIVHRDAAKTTHCSFAVPLFDICMTGYNIYVRFDKEGWEGSDNHDYDIVEVPIEKEFWMVVSETAIQGQRFSSNMRDELQSNRMLASAFGHQAPEKFRGDITDKFQQWTQAAFTTKNGNVVLGVGAGQKLRGMNIGGLRPTRIVVDDMYSEENTKTEERRENVRRWYNNALVNTADANRGSIALVGTVVHGDTVIHDAEKSSTYRVYKYPVVGLEELNKALQACKIDYDKRSMELPSYEEVVKMQEGFTTLSWPERHSLWAILMMYKEKWELRKTQYFYQEYLHILEPEEDRTFREDMFTTTNVTYWKEYGEQWCSFEYEGHEWVGIPCVATGVDPAGGETESSSDTAIITSGWVHAYPRIKGFDAISARKVHPDKEKGKLFGLLCRSTIDKMDVTDTTIDTGSHSFKRKGMFDEALRHAREYGSKTIAIEVASTQQLLYREMRKYIQEKGIKGITIKSENPVGLGHKIERIENTMLPLVRKTESYIVHTGQGAQDNLIAHYQLLNVKTADKIDGADAWGSYSQKNAPKVKNADYELFTTHTNNVKRERKRSTDWEVM